MKGRVRCKHRCAACRGRFGGEPLRCSCGRAPESGIYIDLHWGKPVERLKIYSTKRGETFDSWRAANRTLESIRLAIDDEVFNPEDYQAKQLAELRWDSYVEAHLTRLQARHEAGKVALSTVRQARSICRRFLLIQPLKGRDIRQIRAGHLDDFRLKIRTHPVTGRPTSLSTQAVVITRLNAIFHEAVAREDLSKTPRLPPVEHPELDYQIPSERERARIFERIPEEHRAIFLWVRHQPTRPIEACRLMRSSLRLRDGIALITRKSRKTGPPIEMPLHSEVRACLEGLEVRGLHVFMRWCRGAWRPYTTQFMDKVWDKARREAKLEQFDLYPSTRHFIATRAVRAGEDIGRVCKALGHSSPAVTHRIYAHYNAESIRSIIEPLPRRRKRTQGSDPDRTQAHSGV